MKTAWWIGIFASIMMPTKGDDDKYEDYRATIGLNQASSADEAELQLAFIERCVALHPYNLRWGQHKRGKDEFRKLTTAYDALKVSPVMPNDDDLLGSSLELTVFQGLFAHIDPPFYNLELLRQPSFWARFPPWDKIRVNRTHVMRVYPWQQIIFNGAPVPSDLDWPDWMANTLSAPAQKLYGGKIPKAKVPEVFCQIASEVLGSAEPMIPPWLALLWELSLAIMASLVDRTAISVYTVLASLDMLQHLMGHAVGFIVGPVQTVLNWARRDELRIPCLVGLAAVSWLVKDDAGWLPLRFNRILGLVWVYDGLQLLLSQGLLFVANEHENGNNRVRMLDAVLHSARIALEFLLAIILGGALMVLAVFCLVYMVGVGIIFCLDYFGADSMTMTIDQEYITGPHTHSLVNALTLIAVALPLIVHSELRRTARIVFRRGTTRAWRWLLRRSVPQKIPKGPDDVCGFCLNVLSIDDPANPVIFCRWGCGRPVHESCMRQWLVRRNDCIFCQAWWH